jgi:hypothetical protein
MKDIAREKNMAATWKLSFAPRGTSERCYLGAGQLGRFLTVLSCVAQWKGDMKYGETSLKNAGHHPHTLLRDERHVD